MQGHRACSSIQALHSALQALPGRGSAACCTPPPANHLTTPAPLAPLLPGIPTQPAVSAVSGDKASASLTWGAIHTATKYVVAPKKGSALMSDVAPREVAATDAATLTQTFTNLGKGTWSFEVTATNANDDTSTAAATRLVTVGEPEQPTVVSVQGSVGKATVQFRQAQLWPSA